jgi:polyvinyl alcohol dehydrogenase (cytochrome)
MAERLGFRRRLWAILPLLTLACLIAGVQLAGSTRAQTDAAPARDGAAIYAQQCASCHEGQVPKAPHSVTFSMLGPHAIYTALTDGVMKAQGAALTEQERRNVAETLGGRSLDAESAAPPPVCAAERREFDRTRGVRLAGWGMTLEGTRFVAADVAKLPAADVGKLELAWAFGFPGATRARSQPTVAGGSIFVGSQNGTFYSLDFETGCVRWSFKADAEVRTSPTIEPWSPADKAAKPRVFFGDFNGNAYALDATSGTLIWKRRIDAHDRVTITGAPRLFDGRLYVPMSSTEWAAAADPSYECCTFRGGVVALDAATGTEIWKAHTIETAAKLTGQKNSNGARQWHPAGAPVWNSPTIDVRRKRLYVGTGEAYTSPAANTSDSVIAFDLATGRQLWHYQSLPGDAWNMACFIGGGPNCPRENGPDLDIGASPALVRLADGRDVVVAGQKSADVFALDPDTGRVVWKTRTGRGGYAGGVHWGFSVEGTTLLVPSADTLFLSTDVQRGEAKPGLFALDAATGAQKWFTPAVDDCAPELKPACDPGLSAAATAIPGVVFAGAFDGKLRAYDTATGRVLWQFDTNREFTTVGGGKAHGGSIEAAGPVIVDGAVLVNSGYLFGGRMPGNVLLKFVVR